MRRAQDLIGHDCINLRLSTHGGLYAWEFEKGGRELKVRVEGQLTFNRTFHMLYPNRRQSSAAFSLLVDALRYRA